MWSGGVWQARSAEGRGEEELTIRPPGSTWEEERPMINRGMH